jgi:hypothetical protein
MKSKFEVIESSIPIANINEAQKKVLHEVRDLTEKVGLLLHKFELDSPGSTIVEIRFNGEEVYFMVESFRPFVPSAVDSLKQTICILVGEFEQRHPPCFISKIINSAEGVDVTANTPPGYGSN